MVRVTRSVGLRRLEKLADFLAALPRKRFFYADWTQRDGDATPVEKLSLDECGTKGCALGWATAIPAFRRAGLVLRDEAPALRGYLTHQPDPVGAGARFFGLDYQEAYALFTGHDLYHYKDGGRRWASEVLPRLEKTEAATPRQIARRIRKFIAYAKETP